MKPHNLKNRFRQARMARFVELVDLTTRVRILDIGGTADFWRAVPTLYGLDNIEITVCNIDKDERDERNLRLRYGDATSLPFVNESFDIVHSNSVIEHVGGWPEIQLMAKEVRRLAPAYFVQTPNYWFPLEPHYRLPFVQFIPEKPRKTLVNALGRECSMPIELLTKQQMRALFPDATIEIERFAGLPKSIYAIR